MGEQNEPKAPAPPIPPKPIQTQLITESFNLKIENNNSDSNEKK